MGNADVRKVYFTFSAVSGIVHRERRPLDLEELAKSIPGGGRPEHGAQSVLQHVLSYIEFLQRKIREAQSRLIAPKSSQGALLPLWTPGITRNPNVTPKRGKASSPPSRPKKSRTKDRTGGCTADLHSRRWLSLHGHRETEQRSVDENAEPRQESPADLKEEADLIPGEAGRQTLVPYMSPSSSDNGDTGPWLRSISLSPSILRSSGLPCSPHAPSTPSMHLGLSPSLFSSPSEHLLHSESSQVLFEEVHLSSCSSSDLQDSCLPAAFTLDHSYQTQSESNPASRCLKHTRDGMDRGGDVVRRAQQSQQRRAEERCEARRQLLKKEPCARPSEEAGKTGKRHKRRSRGFSRLQHLRKKCVNGFIMFCRVNRKPYLSAHPGTASTTATKELAELWREMSAQERQPYRVKALQFSLLHDRLVKKRSSCAPQADLSPLKPLSVLLAGKTPRPTKP
ncbi:meiosis initiator protein [Spea bombifrons]|uniref:meiosis initiator protein n=1 Tax=Spea bombifrons TaxID=233779 RepID=UPI0023496D32|nr:meiosis initiator protein [Spea bombifrons]